MPVSMQCNHLTGVAKVRFENEAYWRTIYVVLLAAICGARTFLYPIPIRKVGVRAKALSAIPTALTKTSLQIAATQNLNRAAHWCEG